MSDEQFRRLIGELNALGFLITLGFAVTMAVVALTR